MSHFAESIPVVKRRISVFAKYFPLKLEHPKYVPLIETKFHTLTYKNKWVEASWKVVAHAQKTDFVFPRNGRVHLNRRGRQFSRLMAAEVCASAVVMLDTPCSEVVWRVLATNSIRQFPLHFSFRASPCAITFQLDSTNLCYKHSDTNRLNSTLTLAFLVPNQNKWWPRPADTSGRRQCPAAC